MPCPAEALGEVFSDVLIRVLTSQKECRPEETSLIREDEPSEKRLEIKHDSCT